MRRNSWNLYTCGPLAARAGLVPLWQRGRPPWVRRRRRGVGRSYRRDRVRWRAGAAVPVMLRRSPAPVEFENVRSSWPPPESDQRRAWCSCCGLPRGAGSSLQYGDPARLRSSSTPAHGITQDLQNGGFLSKRRGLGIEIARFREHMPRRWACAGEEGGAGRGAGRRPEP